MDYSKEDLFEDVEELRAMLLKQSKDLAAIRTDILDNHLVFLNALNSLSKGHTLKFVSEKDEKGNVTKYEFGEEKKLNRTAGFLSRDL